MCGNVIWIIRVFIYWQTLKTQQFQMIQICFSTSETSKHTSMNVNFMVYFWWFEWFYVPPGMIGGTLCFRVVLHSVSPSVCVLRPAKAMTNKLSCMHCNFFWPWPLFNLFPRSYLTWILFNNLHRGVPLCVHHPAKAMTFQQIIMHVFQCPHDVDVHLLFCFDLDIHLTCSQSHV